MNRSLIRPPPAVEVCILAGGLSSRLGRNKALLRLGGRALLGHIRATARELGCPVRMIRRDCVPRCGPLGGVLTALRNPRAPVVLFLACDLPFVSVKLLRAVLRPLSRSRRAVFTATEAGAGFPFALAAETVSVVEQQMAMKRFSLQALAQVLAAAAVRLPKSRATEVFNVNTPAEWAQARALWRSRRCSSQT